MKSTNGGNRTIMSASALANAWSPLILDIESRNNNNSGNRKTIHAAIERTIPLLHDDDTSVPFVCRYRMDVIHPMTTKQVHRLRELISKHKSLKGLRTKLQSHLHHNYDSNNRKEVMERIATSVSKTELEDFYAPFKPEPKGSILQRIKDQHPKMVDTVERLWNGTVAGDDDHSCKKKINLSHLQPRDALIQLLSTKLSAEPKIMLFVMEKLKLYCRIQTNVIKDPQKKYMQYHNFQHQNRINDLKDHCVLAIRRGVEQKAIRMKFFIDGSVMENKIEQFILQQNDGSSFLSKNSMLIPIQLLQNKRLFREVIHDAWTRLIRRRGTSRLWSEKCKAAQERACDVFQTNLRRALLAPPYPGSDILLSLDPGYKAGIKCAILNKTKCPDVHKIKTIKFIGNNSIRALATKELGNLIMETKQLMIDENKDITKQKGIVKVIIALGNGHGSQETRTLIDEAVKFVKIPIDVQIVSESGASVWSVTDNAREEFPHEDAASIASVSIGRRLQNPLHELVKVPPVSLGLGMYQHDLSAKKLDERLHLTSVDAVSTVGVDLNSCSIEILCKVPGLSSKTLAEKIVKSRPFTSRHDLLKVSGLGPKTFENCAAFCRVIGPEPLDSTIVHPESYDLARCLMKKIPLNWNNIENEGVPRRDEWGKIWEAEIKESSKQFGIDSCRVLAVLANLIDSWMNVDPRLRELDVALTIQNSTIGSIQNCFKLPTHMLDSKTLIPSLPLRGIIGVISNVTDFGVFVDFGYSRDGLVHVSKLGGIKIENLLIGQQLGVDVLNIDNDRITLSLNGLNLEATTVGKTKAHGSHFHHKSVVVLRTSRNTARGQKRKTTEKSLTKTLKKRRCK